MLTTWGRVLTRTTGFNALKPLLAYRTVIPVGHRGLATATATKKAAPTVTKKTAATKSTTTAKARAPAKKTTTTATSKKAAPKTVAAAAKKPASAKTKDNAPKKHLKKTEEEKAREKIKSLIERALKPPVIHSVRSPWISFLKQKYAAAKSTGVAPVFGKDTSQWAQEYHNLSAAQLEALQAQADSSKDAGQQALADWVKQYTPAQIHDANLARHSIRLIKEKSEKAPRGLGGTFSDIPDDRYPRRPRTANIFYIMEKMRSIPKEKKVEALPSIMKEFTALPEAEKQKWKDLAAKDSIRYNNELRTIGIEPRKTE